MSLFTFLRSYLHSAILAFSHIHIHSYSPSRLLILVPSCFLVCSSLTSSWRRGGVLLPMAVTPPCDPLIARDVSYIFPLSGSPIHILLSVTRSGFHSLWALLPVRKSRRPDRPLQRSIHQFYLQLLPLFILSLSIAALILISFPHRNDNLPTHNSSNSIPLDRHDIKSLMNYGMVVSPLYLICAKSDAARLHSFPLTTRRFTIAQWCASSSGMHPIPRHTA
jgi:hypothetical protein